MAEDAARKFPNRAPGLGPADAVDEGHMSPARPEAEE
jgi:hypothetical protein